jgi:hypothetical protein
MEVRFRWEPTCRLGGAECVVDNPSRPSGSSPLPRSGPGPRGLSPPVDQVRSQNATWVEASWGDKTFDFPIASTEIGSAPEAGRGRPGILGGRRRSITTPG